eukprot:COSAG05_NODE_163_length_15471_cov_29.575072_6_plen_71_part_00
MVAAAAAGVALASAAALLGSLYTSRHHHRFRERTRLQLMSTTLRLLPVSEANYNAVLQVRRHHMCEASSR